MLMVDIAVVSVALPYLARDLQPRSAGVQWVADGYALALAAVVLSAGSAADRLGRRRVFTAGLAAFTAARERGARWPPAQRLSGLRSRWVPPPAGS